MRFYRLIIVPFVLFFFSGQCQHSEIGILGGASYYVGELNPSTQVFNKIRPAVGVFFRRNMGRRYALRFGLNYGKLSAADNFSSSELSDYRQLSFSSNVYEAYGILEFNFFPYEIGSYSTASATPFVFIGGAVFRVSPTLDGDGAVRTSTQGSTTAPSMPFGMGVKFTIGRSWGMALEWGMRKTLTDQIDGLSETYLNGQQLSNTQNKDWYSIIGLSINYKILTKSMRCKGPVN